MNQEHFDLVPAAEYPHLETQVHDVLLAAVRRRPELVPKSLALTAERVAAGAIFLVSGGYDTYAWLYGSKWCRYVLAALERAELYELCAGLQGAIDTVRCPFDDTW